MQQQINIRLEKEINDVLEYFSQKHHVAKAIYVKQIFLEGFTEKILPELLEDYSKGKIGLKTILRLTSLSPDELLDRIVELDIDPPITSEIDDYTAEIAEKMAKEWKALKT